MCIYINHLSTICNTKQLKYIVNIELSTNSRGWLLVKNKKGIMPFGLVFKWYIVFS